MVEYYSVVFIHKAKEVDQDEWFKLANWSVGTQMVKRDLTPRFVDDSLLEIVGFKDAWHGLVLLCRNEHGTRLAQGAADHTYVRMDGEPWKQLLPVDDDTVMEEISHHGQGYKS